MTEQLHKLIDSGARQPVINERISGILEGTKIILSDHEIRIRFMERWISYALGAIGMISAILYLISVIRRQ